MSTDPEPDMKKSKAVLFLGLLVLALLLAGQSVPAQDEEAAVKEELETFVPSEKLPADAAISFPVDI
jgi:hypothetical protein